ncbi:HAD hydrolase-like protein [Patescibacteria group bacterium]|nr:HAD hydrolase-like protein [Patescibacteria group bacterium]
MEEKIIIFDFDGVIVDSFDVAFEVNRLARPTITRERYQAKFNGNIADAKYEDEKVREIDFFYEHGERFKKLGIKQDIKEALVSLSKDHKLFIVSSTINSIIEEYLNRHGLLDSFTEILGFDVETSKVKKFNMIFEKHNVSPSQAIFLTDTSGDIEEAMEAKINFIVGILGGYQDEDNLKKAKPNAIVKDFNNFFSLIKKECTK